MKDENVFSIEFRSKLSRTCKLYAFLQATGYIIIGVSIGLTSGANLSFMFGVVSIPIFWVIVSLASYFFVARENLTAHDDLVSWLPSEYSKDLNEQLSQRNVFRLVTSSWFISYIKTKDKEYKPNIAKRMSQNNEK